MRNVTINMQIRNKKGRFPIVHGMMVDEDHHDVLSTLDQYINSEDEYTVRVRFDEDDYMYIEFQLDDGIIEIDENGWYVA